MGRYSGPDLLTEDFWGRYPRVVACEYAMKWIEHLACTRMADRTVHSYAAELQIFLAYCEESGCDACTADLGTIDEFFAGMSRVGRGGHKIVWLDTRTGLARSTLHHRATVLKMWFEYLVLRGVRESNPLELSRTSRFGVQRSRTYMRVPARSLYVPDEASWWALWSHLVMHGDERDRFMMRLSYDCALRVSELVNVEISDFDWREMMLRVDGKGGRERHVPFMPSLEKAFIRYMDWRSQVRTGPGPLFVSTSNRNYGERIAAGTWDDRVKEFRAAVNLPRLRTHTMRHLCCTDLARQGMPIQYIAAFAGHRSLRTTQVYIDISGVEVKRALKAGMRDLRAWRADAIERMAAK